MTAAEDSARRMGRAGGNDGPDRLVRFLAWANVYCLAMFLFQVVVVLIIGLPGPKAALAGEGGPVAWLMLLLYPAAVIAAGTRVAYTPHGGLRDDADRLSRANGWIVRGAFFAVFYVGVADALVSFLRIEDLLAPIFGEALAGDLGRSRFRGPWLHLPLVGLGFLTAIRARTPGFTWLALLIVVAELLIVVSRFVFSYEQSFMGDLVRFWYAALFLFASAYTFLDEGHVRVDVLYAGMSQRAKGVVNATGCLLLGIVLCWVILLLGMGATTSTIIKPLLTFEITQTTTGMYVKYLMAGFLGVFAVTMLIQFCANLMDAVADWRGHPGHRDHDPTAPA